MKREFKLGDIVKDGTIVSSIKAIKDGNAVLFKDCKVDINKLLPVEIEAFSCQNVILDSSIPLRAPIVPAGKSVPRWRPRPFYECSIEGKEIQSIIDENGIKYVHELQDWLSQHYPEFFLKMRFE